MQVKQSPALRPGFQNEEDLGPSGSHYEEVGAADRGEIGQRRELDRRSGSTSVGIEGQRAGGGVVDDAIVGIDRAAVVERFGGQRAGGEAGEDRVVEMEGVGSGIEVHDDVDATVQRRIEDNGVVAFAAQSNVGAEPAIEDVVADPADQDVVVARP